MGKSTRKSQEREEGLKEAFVKSLTKHKSQKQTRIKTKKMTAGDVYWSIKRLQGYSSLSFIRKPEHWKSKNYNLEKQQLSYIRWVLCKYSTPAFLLKAFLNLDTNIEYCDWASAVAQGESLYKRIRPLLTKKECHLFLCFSNEGSIEKNIWFARCLAQEIPRGLSNMISTLLLEKNASIGLPKWIEFIHFIGIYHEQFDSNTIHEVIDFVQHDWVAIRTFAKRTASSIVKMSNDWHQNIAQQKEMGTYSEWEGYDIPPWEFDGTTAEWKVSEIKTSTGLFREGRLQRHCVASYLSSCQEGRIAIFSMEWNDKEGGRGGRVTIQLDHIKRVTQARGAYNRSVTVREKSVIKRWATANNLIMGRLW